MQFFKSFQIMQFVQSFRLFVFKTLQQNNTYLKITNVFECFRLYLFMIEVLTIESLSQNIK